MDSLYPDYKGPNGSGTKIQLDYELFSRSLLNLEVQEEVKSDVRFPLIMKNEIQPRDLCLRDLGYFSIDHLTDIEEKGGYLLSRLKNHTHLYQQNEAEKWKKIDPLKETERLQPGEIF